MMAASVLAEQLPVVADTAEPELPVADTQLVAEDTGRHTAAGAVEADTPELPPVAVDTAGGIAADTLRGHRKSPVADSRPSARSEGWPSTPQTRTDHDPLVDRSSPGSD